MGCCPDKMQSTGILKTGAITLLLIFNYYFFSIVLTFYNKKVVTRFSYPLTMTFMHLVVKFVLASCVRNILECHRRKPRTTLNWRAFVLKIGPIGITSILDIGLSNWSLEFITISLYTMTKTTSIVFLLIFAVLLKVEKFRWLQLCVVMCISLGLFLFTFRSTQFNATGFFMCLVASLVSGLRWSLTQMAAQKEELGLTNPVDFMYHVQPWMIAGLLPLALSMEGMEFASDDDFLDYKSPTTIIQNMAVLIGGALLAFGLEFGEYLLVMKTSSLTFSVSAMFKECAVLLLAHWLNKDEMNAVNLMGLLACLVGITFHVYLKATKAVKAVSTNAGGDSAIRYSSIPAIDSQHRDSDDMEETGT